MSRWRDTRNQFIDGSILLAGDDRQIGSVARAVVLTNDHGNYPIPAASGNNVRHGPTDADHTWSWTADMPDGTWHSGASRTRELAKLAVEQHCRGFCQ